MCSVLGVEKVLRAQVAALLWWEGGGDAAGAPTAEVIGAGLEVAVDFVAWVEVAMCEAMNVERVCEVAAELDSQGSLHRVDIEQRGKAGPVEGFGDVKAPVEVVLLHPSVLVCNGAKRIGDEGKANAGECGYNVALDVYRHSVQGGAGDLKPKVAVLRRAVPVVKLECVLFEAQLVVAHRGGDCQSCEVRLNEIDDWDEIVDNKLLVGEGVAEGDAELAHGDVRGEKRRETADDGGGNVAKHGVVADVTSRLLDKDAADVFAVVPSNLHPRHVHDIWVLSSIVPSGVPVVPLSVRVLPIENILKVAHIDVRLGRERRGRVMLCKGCICRISECMSKQGIEVSKPEKAWHVKIPQEFEMSGHEWLLLSGRGPMMSSIVGSRGGGLRECWIGIERGGRDQGQNREGGRVMEGGNGTIARWRRASSRLGGATVSATRLEGGTEGRGLGWGKKKIWQTRS